MIDPEARLVAALDALDAPPWCEGTVRPAAVVIRVAAEAISAAAPDLVAWLDARSEPAPFGDGAETRYDENVRSTRRLRARGAATIEGLVLAQILDRIESVFGSDRTISATLADVLVYPVGGKFARHKDTPRTADQLGTLIIELPVAHEGGTFSLTTGTAHHVVDWSSPGDTTALRWVALYGDVDHEVAAVTSGARVTLVYSLALTQTRRENLALAAGIDALADAAIAMVEYLEEIWVIADPYQIPCARMIITGSEAERPLPLDVLRGRDRVIADTLVRIGATVTVREVVVVHAERIATLDEDFFEKARNVVHALPPEVRGAMGLGFSYQADGDNEGPYVALGPYLEWPKQLTGYVARAAGRATLIHEQQVSETGYFGNEYYYGLVYQVALLEVVFPVRDPSKR